MARNSDFSNPFAALASVDYFVGGKAGGGPNDAGQDAGVAETNGGDAEVQPTTPAMPAPLEAVTPRVPDIERDVDSDVESQQLPEVESPSLFFAICLMLTAFSQDQ